MKRFYIPVDYRSRKEMTDFLCGHFRYYTSNSWNRSESYACNLKIYNLGLDHEAEQKLYELMETQEFFDVQNALLEEFGIQHQYLWQAGMNGRSGGYLVLYQGEQKPSGYRSVCPVCGQKNYRSVSDGGNVCGRCGRHSRLDFEKVHMQTAIYPGRGTDEGEDFEDWSLAELKERVKLVQELDQLADRLVDEALVLVRDFFVAAEEYTIPRTRKVLCPVNA